MASTKPLLALAVALLISAPACAATARATGASTAPPSPAAVPVYTLDGAEHRRPTDVDWDAASRTFFVSTYNEGILYRGGLDDSLTPVFLHGQPGQTADGLRIAGGRIYVCAGTEHQVRVYDLATRQRTGTFETGSGGHVIDLEVTGPGDVYVTDAILPMLWHLTPDQIAAGSGTAEGMPVTPEIPIHGDFNLTGIVALTDHRLIVSHHADGLLYRIDLDANGGRTIAPVTGTVVPLAAGLALDGNQVLVADGKGLRRLRLATTPAAPRSVGQIRDPSFRNAVAVAVAGDRYLVANFADQGPPPDTVSSQRPGDQVTMLSRPVLS